MSAAGRCPVCALVVGLRDNGEIEYHDAPGTPWQCRGVGQDPDPRSDLERAEAWAREWSSEHQGHLQVLLREYDLRGADLATALPVVKAARALLEHRGDHLVDTSVIKGRELEGLFDQLAARVRAYTDTTGGGMCPFCERPRRLCWCDK